MTAPVSPAWSERNSPISQLGISEIAISGRAGAMAFITPEMACQSPATTPYSADTIAVPDSLLATGRASILTEPLIPSAPPEVRQCGHEVRVVAVNLRRPQQLGRDEELGQRQASGHH